MAGNTFIKLVGSDGKTIEGESRQKGHHGDDGWIEIADWSWELEAEPSANKGTGSAVGKAKAGACSWSHYYDKASPILMNKIVQGVAFKTATIDMLKQTGKKEPEVYYQMIFEDAFITKVSTKCGEDGSTNQDIDMVAKKITVGYMMQDDKTNELDKKKVQTFGFDVVKVKTDETTPVFK